ncbi:MAG: protein O-mannosyl-transferase family [Candidatus Promineifilaceae bacterium]
MPVYEGQPGGRILDRILAMLLFVIAGLAFSRLLYEGLFPRFVILGRPLPALLIAGSVAAAAWITWYVLYDRRLQSAGQAFLNSAAALLPLLLNLFYLFDPAVNIAASRFLFAASLWLSAVFLARQMVSPSRWGWPGILLTWLALFPLYLLTMPAVVGRADAFEFQVVIPQLGIAHPTGYPLYILLGRIFTLIPFGSVAWRINLASAVFAASAASFVYLAGWRYWKEPLAALLAAVLFGLTPTLWSQAVEAEVYALHTLFVGLALWLMAVMLDQGSSEDACSAPPSGWPGSWPWERTIWLLAFVIGLGLANHLTTIILLPPALLAMWLAYNQCLLSQDWRANGTLLLKMFLALLLPLLLYAYLPVRWAATQDEAMGWDRFIDWVIGGRFQGALQLTAWLTDLTRYEIVWRLTVAEWGLFNLLVALLGLVYAVRRSWRAALVLLVTLAGYIFYALNYHVPDLAVFLIPAHIVLALFWGAGLAAALAMISVLLERYELTQWLAPAIAFVTLLLLLPALVRVVNEWPDSTYSDQVALQIWGEGVLSMPLEKNAAILADSEKIAPLYYLQQAEGLRPDLDIMVLPDEAAYRSELDARISAGQTVYLARFLPGLQTVYHLRSRGPLIEVSSEPLEELPAGVRDSDLRFNGLRLVGYQIEEPSAVDLESTGVTLFWQTDEAVEQPYYIYVRWSGRDYEGLPDVPGGAHPAANYYPTAAFRPGEIVPDYHLLPRPAAGTTLRLDLQVAAGPQFADPQYLEWQTAATVDVAPAAVVDGAVAFRAQNGRMLLSQAAFPSEIRPGTPLPLVVGGNAPHADLLEFSLLPLEDTVDLQPRPGTLVIDRLTPEPLIYATEVKTNQQKGRYRLISRDPLSASSCGWMASPTSGCILGEVVISGVPLPADAANFDDKVALLDINLPSRQLAPGGTLPVQLRWQGLTNMVENYTIFLQVLNEQDQIVGQVDAWPLQGTYPTSQWAIGEIIEDPYEIQLSADLPPGNYRLQVGLYLLSTLRRLPVLDAQGQPLDDKVIVSDLTSD